MERIRLLIEDKKYKDAYEYIIKEFKEEDYYNWFRDIKNVAFGLVSIYNNSKALRLFREIDKRKLEEDTKTEIIRILTRGKKYKVAYEYIIKNFKEKDYCNYFGDIRNVIFGLIDIGNNSKALRLFRRLGKIKLDEEVKIEIVRILTRGKKYKAAYRYIIENLKQKQYCDYYKDIRNVSYGLVNIGKNREALKLFKKLKNVGLDVKIEIIRILSVSQKYIFLYKYIIKNYKEQYYKYINSYIFNVKLEKLSDIKLLELEKIYWHLLNFLDDIKILNIEIKLVKLYCYKKINFVKKSQFIILIYNKIFINSNVIIKKIYNKLISLLEQNYYTTNIKSFPQILSIQLTNKCNAKCKFCDVIYKKEWELPKDVYIEVLTLLPTLIKVNWLGGEVFLYKNFKELFIKAKECNVRQEIITNGMLLTKEWIDEFISSNVNLAISIRSTEKEKYEYLTEGANFEKLIFKLEYLKEQFYKRNKNFRLSMFVLVTKYNYMELEKFIKFAYHYKFNLVRFIQLDNIKDSLKSDDICNSKNELYSELVKIFNRAIILANKYGIKIKNELPLDIQNEEIIKNEKISDFNINQYIIDSHKFDIDDKNFNIDNIFCVWPWKEIQIDSGGDMFFNCFCQGRMFGNVKHYSILELWNSKQVIDFRKKIINNDYENICNKMCVLDNVHRKNII